MKRAISVSILLIILFFTFQWGLIYLKKGHEVSYQVSFEDKIFEVSEKYNKENGDYYDIVLKNRDKVFYYALGNHFNKRQKVIKNIEYFEENDNFCIYPILENGEGTYIMCIKDGKQYTDVSFPNQDFITKVRTNLQEKGYSVSINYDLETVEQLSNTTIYQNNLLDTDTIALWNYKGIQVIRTKKSDIKLVLGFDKYENNHGYLVGKYYVIPEYLSSKVLEFSKVNIIDLETLEHETIELNNTLSSGTYINGIVDNKLYYIDPSNLLQVEVNPSKKSARLIGSKELGGQFYHGNWEDINIYDFVSNTITFQEELPTEITNNFSYVDIVEGSTSYYFTTQNGEVYQVPKEHLDVSILLFSASGLNNFKVIEDTIYYVSDNTVYYYQTNTGMIPILTNNELRYNTKNRIDIFRKS